MKKSKATPSELADPGSPWMNKALRLAKQAYRKSEVPVGALIVCDGKQISSGYNLREKKQDPTAHAEMIAITRAAKKLTSWRLIGCTLYVTLEPCPMCLAAAQQARISKIIYGTKDPKGGALCLGYKLHETHVLTTDLLWSFSTFRNAPVF